MLERLLISISGAFSTGKTTLAEALRQAMPDAAVIADGARAARTARAEFDWSRPDARAFLYWHQLVREAQTTAPVILCDTSLIDVLAHHEIYQVSPPTDAAAHDGRYDIALLCDASEIVLTEDGLRDTDVRRRAELNTLIRDQAARLAKHICHLSGDTSSRLAKAIDIIRTARGTMKKATIFISYSNYDASFVKDQARGKPFFTRALERVRGGNCCLFISGFETDAWKPEVAAILDRTDIFIPLISDDFLGSKSCAHEVKIIRARKERGEGVAIAPFLYRYCLYDDVPWLNEAPVWRSPGEFFSKEVTEHEREHFIINFRNKVETILDRLEALRP